MRSLKNLIGLLLPLFVLTNAMDSFAQLAAPNAAGVSVGHAQLIVSSKAKHRQYWITLGGVAGILGTRNYIAFPGIYIFLTQGQPVAPSIDTSANHIGFSVQDYAAYKNKLMDVGATIFFENEDDGQILADLPDGVRIEILTDKTQASPIMFHHMHVVAANPKGLQEWYLKVFGADAGERRDLPSAIVPGGRVDILSVGDGMSAPRGSKGGAIDHFGFEVADMEAFASHVKTLGITFVVEPKHIEVNGLNVAYLTDPAGTYIEVTEGLTKIKQ